MAPARDTPPPDHELVAAARHGSTAAFGSLAERHYGALLRYLAHQTGDPDLATDLTQETFLTAFRQLHQLAGHHAFAAWLYRIARNTARMEQRRRRLRHVVSLDRLLARTEPVRPALCRSDASAACHERDSIQQVLAELSPPLREALLLHSVGGFTSQEVARILGIAPAAARQRIGRAKEQFRPRYRALNGADHDVRL